MVVGGILDMSEAMEHSAASVDQCITRSMLEFSLLVNLAVQRVDMEPGRKVKIRIGVNHGPVVTGLVGR